MNKYFKYLIPLFAFLLIIMLTSCQSKEIRELETKIILLEEENTELKRELKERPVLEMIMEPAIEKYEFEGIEISCEELEKKADELLGIIDVLESKIESMEGNNNENIEKESSENNESTEEISEIDSSNNSSNIQPIIDSAKDSLGHINTNSWAKETGGDWSSGGLEASPTIYIGDVITFTINVSNPTNLEYRFEMPGGTIQDWSTSNVCTWTVTKEAYGKWKVVTAQVRNNDGLNFLEFCDDYTYLTYTVLSK